MKYATQLFTLDVTNWLDSVQQTIYGYAKHAHLKLRLDKQIINCDSDKFYEKDCDDGDENIQQNSNILNNCKSYPVNELNNAIHW
jgi:hypothetical protein